MDLIIVWILSALVGIALTWAVIFTAVRAAMLSHFKTVRWFEATGEWAPRTSGISRPPGKIGAP